MSREVSTVNAIMAMMNVIDRATNINTAPRLARSLRVREIMVPQPPFLVCDSGYTIDDDYGCVQDSKLFMRDYIGSGGVALLQKLATAYGYLLRGPTRGLVADSYL